MYDILSSSSSYLPPKPTLLSSSSLSSSPVPLSCKFVMVGSKFLSPPSSFFFCKISLFQILCMSYTGSPVFLCYPVKLFILNLLTSATVNFLLFCNFPFYLHSHQFSWIIVTIIGRESYHLMPPFVSHLIQLICIVSCLKGSTCFKSSALVCL